MTNDIATASTIPAPPEPIVSRCCHDITESEWASLPLARDGYMHDGEGGVLELRNCVCGSTRAVLLLDVPPLSELLAAFDAEHGPTRDPVDYEVLT